VRVCVCVRLCLCLCVYIYSRYSQINFLDSNLAFPETLDFNELTRLSAREEFINFSRRESFTSYSNLAVATG
jgi:hypothetical protein